MASIRLKLLLTYVASLVIPLLILLLVVILSRLLLFSGSDHYVLTELDRQADQMRNRLEEELRQGSDNAMTEWSEAAPDLHTLIIDPDGLVLFDSLGTYPERISLLTLHQWMDAPGLQNQWYYRVRTVEGPNGEPRGFLVLGAPEERTAVIRIGGTRLQDRLGTILIMLAPLLTLGVSVGLYWQLGSHFVRPLQQLVSVVKQLASGNLSVKVPVDRRDEIGDLAKAIEVMIHQWRQAREAARAAQAAHRYWVAAASHDLRSPLTVIRGHLEGLLRMEECRSPGVAKRLSAVQAKAIQIEELVTGLFELAALDAQTEDWPLAEADLAELVRREAIDMLPQFAEHGMLLDTEIPSHPCLVMAAPQKIQRALQNLFMNAIRYGRSGGVIKISLTPTGERMWRVEVEDRGPGINEADLPVLFERFRRGRETADGQQDGSGLGLAICKEIIDRHGGRVGARNHPEGGAIFWFELPANPLL